MNAQKNALAPFMRLECEVTAPPLYVSKYLSWFRSRFLRIERRRADSASRTVTLVYPPELGARAGLRRRPWPSGDGPGARTAPSLRYEAPLPRSMPTPPCPGAGLLLVGRVVDPRDSAAGRVRVVLEGGVPLDGGRGTAGHRRPPRDGLAGGVVGEVGGEDLAVEVGLLRGGGVVGEPELGLAQLLVRDLVVGVVPQGVDPPVPHAVRELLLLPPQDVPREVRLGLGSRGLRLLGGRGCGLVLLLHLGVEGCAQDPLLDALLALGIDAHLLLRVERHHQLQEVAVQEGHAGLQAPGHRGLVGTEAVEHVQGLDLPDQLLMELRPVGGLVEVQIPPENLVRALATQHHLDPCGLDLARHEEHGCGGPDGGHVIGLQVPDDVRQRVQTLLDGEGV
mmetsp:Transcript_49179/g.82472  ORF Transcript_49179/g.82472 Transcript_49179/m.82472 type:complete len:393 (-) Transcript_49179:914-2092(-)